MNLKTKTEKWIKKWPWASRRKLRAAEQRAENLERDLECSRRSYEELRDELLPKVNEIGDRLFRVGWQRDPGPRRTMRLVVTFDEQELHRAFVHGESNRELAELARHIGVEAARKLRECNAGRWENGGFDEEAERSDKWWGLR